MSGQVESEEDKELQDELQVLMNEITGSEPKPIPLALDMLKFIIRTSTTSMTSVPKPLKYLAPHYEKFKEAYEKIDDPKVKKQCADVISVLAMGTAGGDAARTQRDCLKFCILGGPYEHPSNSNAQHNSYWSVDTEFDLDLLTDQ